MWTAKCTFKFQLQLTALRETSRSSLSVLASMKSRRRLGKLACCVIEKVFFFPGGVGGLYHCANGRSGSLCTCFGGCPQSYVAMMSLILVDVTGTGERVGTFENGWVNHMHPPATQIFVVPSPVAQALDQPQMRDQRREANAKHNLVAGVSLHWQLATGNPQLRQLPSPTTSLVDDTGIHENPSATAICMTKCTTS